MTQNLVVYWHTMWHVYFDQTKLMPIVMNLCLNKMSDKEKEIIDQVSRRQVSKYCLQMTTRRAREVEIEMLINMYLSSW